MTCAKKRVLARIYAPDGRSFTGENVCHNPQTTCPRLPGEGYEKCATICDQPEHAEVAALRLAGDAARGATVRLWGITHYCRQCQAALFAAGVVALEVPDGKPLAANDATAKAAA
jgi:hypothetical protein